jgi:type VI protein secretion system component VasK
VNLKRINWPTWSGLLLSVFAFLSYFFIFVWYPVTRDSPWLNLVLLALAMLLLLLGLRGAFSQGRPLRSRIAASISTGLGLFILLSFLYIFFILGRALPRSTEAPQVGQRAPDFTLIDSNNKSVTLNELLSSPINGKAPRGVLLIFYRGYW